MVDRGLAGQACGVVPRDGAGRGLLLQRQSSDQGSCCDELLVARLVASVACSRVRRCRVVQKGLTNELCPAEAGAPVDGAADACVSAGRASAPAVPLSAGVSLAQRVVFCMGAGLCCYARAAIGAGRGCWFGRTRPLVGGCLHRIPCVRAIEAPLVAMVAGE